MSKDDQLQSIDSSQLEAVTGGVTATDTTSTDLTAMMQQVMTSLQDLTQNQSSSSGGGSSMLMEMLPLMMMMRGQQAQAAAPVVAAPPVGDGSGWIRVV
jgi:hypothetical protein